MSPWERIVAKYAEKGDQSLGRALDFNLAHGFVFSTPAFFIMGRQSDYCTWFIEAFAGDMGKAWDILPYPLEWIAYYRFDKTLHRLPLSVVRRYTRHEVATPIASA